jgi:hypothetical protein
MGYRKAADGIATKGKTKGTAVSMKGYTGMKEGGKVKMAEGGMSKTKKPMSGSLPPLKDEPKGRRPGEGMLQEGLRKIVSPARKGGLAYGGKVKMRSGGAC